MVRSPKDFEPIAIVGVGAMFPGRGDTLGYWRDIVEGVDTLSEVPSSHWLIEDYYDDDVAARDRTYGRRGGFLSPKAFDPLAFGFPPAQLSSTDTSQLLALIVAQAALSEAETCSAGVIDRSRTSVVLGVASATELVAHMAGRLQRPAWIKGLREAGLSEDKVLEAADRISENFSEWNEATFPGLLGNVVAGRIANRLDLGGCNYVTDAACASSLSAVQVAIHELHAGDSDLVLAGGVDTLNDILMYMCFSKTPALSPTEDCRPFSASADGTMLGEGLGIVALRRLSDAERDANQIHAVIRGLGAGSDGKATAIYAPLPAGQARTLKRAYDAAGYSPASVELVEAHGTGTKAGDAAELSGLKHVFAPSGDVESAWCAIGSVKSQIGHTKAAAGAASLIKAAMALNRQILPPTIKVETPAPALDGSPFYANTTARPWVRSDDHPRRASVSSFGFGGSNFHATLEEYTGPHAAVPSRILSSELLLFSADDPIGLVDALDAAIANITSELDLAIEADTSHRRFDRGASVRACIVAATSDDFAAKAARLREAAIAPGLVPPLPAGVDLSRQPAKPGKIAFLFPGQGSQYVGMGRDLALAFPEARAAWDRAFRHPATGPMRLHDLAFPPEAFSAETAERQNADLTALRNAQPALAAASLAMLAVLDKAKLVPDTAAGHSFGEIMALHAAGVVDADAALQVAKTRAELMAKAAETAEGAMLAVQAGADDIAVYLDDASSVVLANDNAPTQAVLSGTISAIDAMADRLSELGIKTRRLPVASAFHSPIVASAVDPFSQALEQIPFSKAAFPVYSNVSAKRHPLAYKQMRGLLASQIEKPVRFREIIERMISDGVRTFVEVGPGRVLSNMVGQIADDPAIAAIALDAKGGDGLAAFLSGVGRLAIEGVNLDIAGLFEGMPAPARPPKPSKHAVELTGANYRKPYPPAGGADALPKPKTTGDVRPSPPPEEPAPAPTLVNHSPHPGVQHMSSSPQITPDAAAERIFAEASKRHSEFVAMAGAVHAQFLDIAAAALGAAPRQTQSSPPKALPLPEPNGALPAVNGALSEAPLTNGVMNGAAHGPNGHAAPALAPSPHTKAPAPEPVAPRVDPAPAAIDHLGLVTEIVSEKTGYPADMLDPDMDLEGELGVDSIKQVEILSTLQERLPELPEVAPEQIAELRSIRLIAEFLGSGSSDTAPARAPNGAASTPDPVRPTPVQSQPAQSVDMAALVRGLIAEKTGYPEDMLEDDMDLEGELGVDSIKQVEILSALQDQAPNLPDIDPSQIGELRTIRKIADFFG